MKVASNFVFGETNHSEAFLKKFPLGKVIVNLCEISNVVSPIASKTILKVICRTYMTPGVDSVPVAFVNFVLFV